jgi:hypothetical protein
LATDAAFAYDMAYRLFGVKLLNRNNGPPTLTADTQQSDPFESEEAKFVFNWLDYADEAMLAVETPERMNFTCPSDYRGKRSKELALRRSASSLDDKKDEGGKKMDILSEEEVVAKVRKEIVSIAKLAAVICPDQKIFGKRASELMFDELPEVDMRSRKKSRKLSLQGAGQQQQQQQQMLSGTASNITLEQMLLQRQMLGQVMGSQIGLYGAMYGAIPSMQTNAVVPSISQPTALPTDGASSTCSSTALSNSSLHQPQPISSTVDSQLLSFLMMQQNMPRNNVPSINGQLLNNRSQFPFNMSSQSNMVSINDQLLNGNIPGQAEQVSLLPKKMDQADKDAKDD